VKLLEKQLHLDRPAITQYRLWVTGMLHGDPGKSLANDTSVSKVVGPRLLNSAGLTILAGVIGSVVAVGAAVIAAWRRDRWFDHTVSLIALTLAALPEFVVAVLLVAFLSTSVFHLLPAVAFFPPQDSVWLQGKLLALP
ncbi:ABC transporter permease, partial [Bradyrhizobium sp. NBAIM08]|nr:ABC transporter permease [Bradyrhizobium sp. NBAIM08]